MKNKENVLNCLTIMLSELIYAPVYARQEHGVQAYIKKSKLFRKVPQKRHNDFILLNSGVPGNFTAGRPTRNTEPTSWPS